MKSWDSNL